MRSAVLLVDAVIILLVLSEEISKKPQRTNYLRNYYKTYEEHARNALVFVNGSAYNREDLNRIRHKRGEDHKLRKVERCRRYAQIYYQNYVGGNCYYSVCRQSYCGYCPTSSCRRRCPYTCTTYPTTEQQRVTTLPPKKECKCDPQGSKFETCDQNTGKCICKPHYKGPKCDQCENGYWRSNATPCTPCNCNQDGSLSQKCEANTGICSCKAGVQGQKCDSCKPKHYGNVRVGCKPCDRCDLEGHICDPNNGKCVCPPLTNGSKCDKCVPNAWGYEPEIGCKACGCSRTGSSKAQCDSVSGRCTCRIGFEGEQCNRCSYGYYGYPNCRKCNCNVAGTVPEDCSHGSCTCSEKGCRCKVNVEGRYCDKCKRGTFGIDKENSAGCMDCFCSGRSDRCAASPFIWDQVRTSDLVTSPSNQCINRGTCWNLPNKFTGDLTQSYGGYLRISSNTPSNIVFLTGNGVTLESSTDSRGDLKIVEGNWRLKHDTNPPKMPKHCHRTVTRSCLMVVLQGITAIEIAPKSPSLTLKFREILLDKISNTPGKSQATSVERCHCPKEYTSPSCQDPNTGYYRHYPTSEETDNYIDRILGVARPCQCNNRSNICDKQTGDCSNCSDHTTGPHCEFCAQGHYRDLSGSCAPCLCPSETQNFAKNCTVAGKKQNHYICDCKTGYTGAKCDTCEDGFWGNPQENGGSCKPCNCNSYGSTDYKCDKTTGKCRCTAGFTGVRCSECTSPRQVIQDGVCAPCDECTQILFYTLDNLSAGLNKTLDLFKDGLGPPWGLLNSTIHEYQLLSNDFDNLDKAKKFIENSNLPKLEERINKMKRELSKQEELLKKQNHEIEVIQKDSRNVTETVLNLNQKFDEFLNRINSFGKSHIDTKEAIREAKEILDHITAIINEAPSTKDYENFFKECNHVFETVSKIYNSTELNPHEIKTQLHELKKRLTQFNVLLDETDSIAKRSKTKNKQNAVRIAALNRTIDEINLKNSIIAKNISDIIRKIEATNDLLEDITGIYQDLSKLDLENETMHLDEDTDFADLYNTLLFNVSNHVKHLQDKIKAYKKVFNFTSEELRKIDASGAYDNLVKGIQQARKLANEARNITRDTLRMLYPPDDDSLIDKTNIAQAFSDRLQKRVHNLKNINKDYKKTAEELEDLKHDILFNGKNNNELNLALRKIKQKIAEQEKYMIKLEKAKEEARNISATIADIEQKLKNTNITMQYELVKTYHKYLDLISKSEKQLEKIQLAKKELQEINAYLDRTKFDEIHDANANKFKNTKENIKSVQDMIEQLNNKIKYAYDRVDEIEYGLKISSCRRFYTLENDIFRSLEIQFKCTDCTLFNITNSKNEMVTISVTNSSVTVIWKNQSYDLGKTTKISFQRIGSTIRVQAEIESCDIKDDEAFQIEQQHPLQVGDLKNKTEACLRRLVLNGQTIGLWKFNRTEGFCPACSRNTTIDGEDGGEDVFFKGKGYRNVTSTAELNPRRFNIIFTFATFDENSLIFLAQEKMNRCSFIALNLVDGKLQLKVRHVNGDHVTLISDETHNNGRNTVAEISMVYNENEESQSYSLQLLVPRRNPETVKRNFNRRNVYKIKKSDIFVGGISSIFNTSCLEVDTTSFLGNLKVTGGDGFRVTSQNSLSNNIERRADEVKFENAWFTGEGHVNLQLEKNRNISQLSFSLRPVNINDSFVMNIHDLMDVYIENSSLRVKTENEDLTVGCLSVNATHFIRIDGDSVRVNNDHKNFTNFFNLTNEQLNLYLGADKYGIHPNFTGSIFDMFDNNGPIPYSTSTIKNFSKVKIGRDEPAHVTSENKCVKEMQNTERYHRIPDYKTDPQAFKFGDKPNSYILIRNSSVGKKFALEFQFRTYYPNGLLFLLSSTHNKSYIVLDVQGGELRLRVQGHRAKLIKMRKVNDGEWHHVHVEQILGKKKWRMVVKLDKQAKLKDRVLKNNFKWELYMGGIARDFPLHKKLKSDLHPFRGCIRSLKINRNLQLVKNNNNVFYNNIGQCFQKVEEGAYFGGDAYAIYKDDFKVNKFLELSFEFKTGEPNGILLSVSSIGNSPALSVELQNGAVVMTIDMGNGIVSKVTNSPHSDATLANNEWHNITALYSSSELTVNVDGVRKSWVQSDVNSLMDEVKAPLFIGGLPNNAPSGTLKIKENFKGCIRKFKIEDNIMDWTDMKELKNVQLNSCLA